MIFGTPGTGKTLLATSGAAVGIRASLPLVPAEAAGYLIAILPRVVAGAALGRTAATAGRAGVVPRVGAAAVAAFALVLVSAPLLR